MCCWLLLRNYFDILILKNSLKNTQWPSLFYSNITSTLNLGRKISNIVPWMLVPCQSMITISVSYMVNTLLLRSRELRLSQMKTLKKYTIWIDLSKLGPHHFPLKKMFQTALSFAPCWRTLNFLISALWTQGTSFLFIKMLNAHIFLASIFSWLTLWWYIIWLNMIYRPG